jgi:hypothetical protein
MSSRVGEPCCKNIWFLGIDTNCCSNLYMFWIWLNHTQSSGVLAGNDAKETKIQKVAKTRNPYKKAAWKSTRPGKKKREPEVVGALQNDTQKHYLKSQLIIKRSSSGIQHSFISWRKLSPYKMMTDFRVNVGSKNLCFL